ncbi:MAG: hypothetical protein JWO33_2709 [Caulobacteraceae bacterium]|nr:hypothetical protein [Caulobacteraceae bacterium]
MPDQTPQQPAGTKTQPSEHPGAHGDKLPNETFDRKNASERFNTGVDTGAIQPGQTGDAKAL